MNVLSQKKANEVVGSNIRRRREELNLKQSELAEKVGGTNVNISTIENGRKGITVYSLLKFAIALQCNISRLTHNLIPDEEDK